MLDKVDLDTPGLKVLTHDSKRVGELTLRRLFVENRGWLVDVLFLSYMRYCDPAKLEKVDA